MSSQINSKDLVEEGVLKPLRDEMDLAIVKSKELSDSLLRVVKSQADMANQTKQNAAGYKELVQLEEKQKKALIEHEKMQARILKLQQMESKLRTAENNDLIKQERLRQAQNKTLQQEEKLKQTKLRTDQALRKESERQEKITKQNASAYFQLTQKIAKLTAEYRDLVTVEGTETRQAQLMRKEILSLNSVRDKSNEALGMHQNKVGQYERALNGLNRTLGQLGLAFGVFQILRDTFGIVSASEDAFASLSAITGLTGEKFDVFKVAIMDTAVELNVSGTVVAEAAEKIASAQPKLLENADALASVTKEAITLNKAIKGDLTETSMALVGVMNQFGEGADEANRIINILAAGSQAGAATVNQINESMVKFGTTADLMNISIEESVGLIETLGEKAIFGSDAGTTLRNILLKMGSIDVLPEKAMKQLEKYGVNTDIVKDKSLSFEERLQELSKVAKDSTAIMQIFGTENATAATVLLNNLGTYEKMTDAVTGSNVATEQAAINSDTLSAVIGELRAAWENLVIKWSEGTNVASGLKSILRFLADNLETVIGVVIKAISAWAAYRLGMMAWNKEGTGFIQVIRKMVLSLKSGETGMKNFGKAIKSIGFGGFLSILTVVVPLLWELGESIWEAWNAQSALVKVQSEAAKKMDEERVQMDKFRYALVQTNAGTKERGLLIDEINKRYGTTLQNLADETEFMNQLWNAYQKVNAEMEKKITKQLIEEEITALMKEKREIERTLKENEAGLVDVILGGSAVTGEAFGTARLEQIKKDLADLQGELFNLNKQTGETGKKISQVSNAHLRTGVKVGSENTKMDPLAELRKKNADELIQLENELLQKGMDREMINERLYTERLNQYEEEINMINELKYSQEEYNKTLNDAIKFQQENAKDISKITRRDTRGDFLDFQKEIEKVKRQQIDVKKTWKEILQEIVQAVGESVRDTMNMISEMMQANTDLIDAQIAKQQTILDGAISREQELRDIARERGLDATESIEAEREAQKKAQKEIEVLEAKKRNLEMMIAAMKLLADGKTVGEIKENLKGIKSFIEGSFYEGTPYTIADALGRTGTRDGHIVRVDDNESVLTGEQTRALGIGKGGNSTQDIVDMFKMMTSPSALVMKPSVHADPIIAKKLDKLIEATTGIPASMPVNDTVFKTMAGYMEWTVRHRNRTTKTRYLPKK